MRPEGVQYIFMHMVPDLDGKNNKKMLGYSVTSPSLHYACGENERGGENVTTSGCQGSK
jgi:hypothetical protein